MAQFETMDGATFALPQPMAMDNMHRRGGDSCLRRGRRRVCESVLGAVAALPLTREQGDNGGLSLPSPGAFGLQTWP